MLAWPLPAALPGSQGDACLPPWTQACHGRAPHPLRPGLPVTESFAFRLVNALSEELHMFVYVLKKKPLWNINI